MNPAPPPARASNIVASPGGIAPPVSFVIDNATNGCTASVSG